MIIQAYLEEVKNETKESKNGKKYIACSIKVNNQWMSGFGSKITELWSTGMTVEIETYQEEYNGKIYKKFKLLKKEDLLEARVAKLEERLNKFAEWAKNIQK